MKVVFDNGVEFRMGASLFAELTHFVFESGTDREVGGILIGIQSTDGTTYEVTAVTFPAKDDERHRRTFVRTKASANCAIGKAWKRSKGKENYLGEWHTHNEPIPRPSMLDKRAARYLAKYGPHPFGRIFLVILGTSNRVFVEMISREDDGMNAEEGVLA